MRYVMRKAMAAKFDVQCIFFKCKHVWEIQLLYMYIKYILKGGNNNYWIMYWMR